MTINEYLMNILLAHNETSIAQNTINIKKPTKGDHLLYDKLFLTNTIINNVNYVLMNCHNFC